jgi:uncharacterized protein YcgL (UPF0745 family)
MHIANLNLGPALSLVERRSNNVVVNQWDPFQRLYKALKEMVTYLFGKKSKTRFTDYEKVLKREGQPVFIIDLPNDTRVAGAYKLIQASLRQAFTLQFFAQQNKNFAAKFLNKGDWKQLAQFEAIMAPSAVFCFTSQSDRVEASGEIVIELLRLKDIYDNEEVFDVVDMNVREDWSADTKFDDIPRTLMATTQEVADVQNIS